MSILVEIVTPTKVALKEQVREVRAPGLLGEFGVLPGHIPLLSVLKPGTVTLSTESGPQVYVVGQGFAEAGPDRLIVLTEVCEKAAEVDKEAAKKLLEDSERAMATLDPNSGDWAFASRNAALARARLSA